MEAEAVKEEIQVEPKLELTLVTNPLWLGGIGPRIAEFVQKMGMGPGITYESFYTHLCQLVQFGQEQAEVWVAVIDGEPAGFTTIILRPLPFIGTVSNDYVHNWSKDRRVVPAFGEKVKEFARKHRARYVYGFTTKPGLRHFRTIADKCGLGFVESIESFTLVLKEN